MFQLEIFDIDLSFVLNEFLHFWVVILVKLVMSLTNPSKIFFRISIRFLNHGMSSSKAHG